MSDPHLAAAVAQRDLDAILRCVVLAAATVEARLDMLPPRMALGIARETLRQIGSALAAGIPAPSPKPEDTDK